MSQVSETLIETDCSDSRIETMCQNEVASGVRHGSEVRELRRHDALRAQVTL